MLTSLRRFFHIPEMLAYVAPLDETNDPAPPTLPELPPVNMEPFETTDLVFEKGMMLVDKLKEYPEAVTLPSRPTCAQLPSHHPQSVCSLVNK